MCMETVCALLSGGTRGRAQLLGLWQSIEPAPQMKSCWGWVLKDGQEVAGAQEAGSERREGHSQED